MLPAYTGDFESHITIDSLPTEQEEGFRALCQILGVKPILITLAVREGQEAPALQPMTAGKHKGTLQDAVEDCQYAAARLDALGYKVTRVKIEAAPWNEGIPQTNTEAEQYPDNYFEFHLKVLLDGPGRYQELGAICQEHNTHLSRNAFKQREDGRLEYFTTMRCYNLGALNAHLEFSKLQIALNEAGFETSGKVCEYTVYDTNLSLDDAWLEA